MVALIKHVHINPASVITIGMTNQLLAAPDVNMLIAFFCPNILGLSEPNHLQQFARPLYSAAIR